MTHCNAFAILARLPVLELSVTRRATIFTPGATPRSLGSSEPIKPAMAVPCCERRRHRIGGVVSEIVAGDDLVAGPKAATQGRVVVIDAGVDHGDGSFRCPCTL